MLRKLLVRTAAGMTLAGGLMLVVAGPVSAAGTTLTVDIAADNTNTKIGTATFTRTALSDGTETLTVHVDVPGGITESKVCLSAEPFTRRAPASGCPYQQGATGTTADYSINLGSTYAGKPLYAQVHVVSQGSTAFAGWQSGNPFYGNVQIAAALADTTVPVLAVGGMMAAAVSAVGLVALLARQRRQAPAETG